MTQIVSELSDSSSLEGLFHEHKDGDPLPSGEMLREIIELSRAILFPGYYGKSEVNQQTVHYHIGVNLERFYHLLVEQVHAALCQTGECNEAERQSDKAHDIVSNFISRLPQIRKVLATDVVAAYNGDPAAESYGEIISCYPVIKALTCYRIAHELLLLGVPLLPRMLTEMAHSDTGIDIHPGAQIGHHFTIDHGTGVVIGATCIIGNHVKLYQGVTLGAKSFPLDEDGKPIKGIPRHPILEDDVTVYANATILGRVTIGKGATIGGNVWITEDIPAGVRILQEKYK